MRWDAAVRRSTATVLVAEDDPWVREVLAAALTDWGYGALPASNGYTALRLARQQEPDLLLLDIGLPELSGADVLRALRADDATHDLPVIVVSGLAGPIPDADRGDLAAVHGKPFDLAALRADVLRCAGPPTGRQPAEPTIGGMAHAGARSPG